MRENALQSGQLGQSSALVAREVQSQAPMPPQLLSAHCIQSIFCDRIQDFLIDHGNRRGKNLSRCQLLFFSGDTVSQLPWGENKHSWWCHFCFLKIFFFSYKITWFLFSYRWVFPPEWRPQPGQDILKSTAKGGDPQLAWTVWPWGIKTIQMPVLIFWQDRWVLGIGNFTASQWFCSVAMFENHPENLSSCEWHLWGWGVYSSILLTSNIELQDLCFINALNSESDFINMSIRKIHKL